MNQKDIDDVEAAGAAVMASFATALDYVTRAIKFLVANGIEPVSEHQELAYSWAKGEITDEQFLIAARLVSSINKMR
jgi:hypothetical protein